MAITVPSTGSVVDSNNADIATVSLGGTAQAGDVIVVSAANRATDSLILGPTGGTFTKVASLPNSIRGGIWLALAAGGETSVGLDKDENIGTSGNTIQAAAGLIRGASQALTLDGTAQNTNNTSQTTANYPGLTVNNDGCILLLLWSGDDNSNSQLTTPGGWTLGAYASTLTGGDQSIAWFYQIQTTKQTITAGSLTVDLATSVVNRTAIVALTAQALATSKGRMMMLGVG